MNYFDSNITNEKLSLDNSEDLKQIEKTIYQEFLRKENSITNDERYVDSNHLENIFTDKVYYQAMKDLSNNEKRILYLYCYEYKNLKEICKILNTSKSEIIKTKLQAIEHFKKNIKKYQKLYFKKNGGDLNE